MSEKIVELFRKSIKNNWHLKRSQKKWQLLENNITIEFKTPDSNSFGFSLDQDKVKDVFGFFGNPPKNITKMCDGIIVLKYKEQTYIFLLEQKTNNSGEYKKQLINGWYFCQWLLGLFKEYKYYNNKIKYIGLLYRNRKNITKESSTHSKPQIKSNKYGINFFKTNQNTIYLESYIKAIIK